MEKIMKNTKSSAKAYFETKRSGDWFNFYFASAFESDNHDVLSDHSFIFISFFEWNLLQKPKFIGIENYRR